MHSTNILAVLLVSNSVQAISFPAFLSEFNLPVSRNLRGALSPRQAPAPAVPAPALPAAAPPAPPVVPAAAPPFPPPPPAPAAAPPAAPPAPAPADGQDGDRRPGGGGGGGGRGGGGWGPPGPGGPPGKPPGAPESKCPAIWTDVSKELTNQFLDNGQCNDLARGAIRAAFHDCAAWQQSLGTSAGCDGSLWLAKEELQRQENGGLVDIVPKLAAIKVKFDGISMADFFQFAGAHAVKTCPMGPTVQTFVGRNDRNTPNPENLIPNPRASGDSLVQLFKDKGISAPELAALIGAHTSAKQFAFDPSKSGAPLDTTSGVWDVQYYGETLKKDAPFTIPSDIELSNQAESGPVFKSFVDNQMGWGAAFAPAMTHLSLLGVSKDGLIDCTSALPGGGMRRQAVKRRAPF